MKRLTFLTTLMLLAVAWLPMHAQGDAGSLDVVEVAEIPIVANMNYTLLSSLMVMSEDGSLLAVVDRRDDSVQLWDAVTPELLASIPAFNPGALAFNGQGTLLAIAGDTVLVVNVDEWRAWGEVTEDNLPDAVEAGVVWNVILNDHAQTGDPMAVAFSPDSATLLRLGASPIPFILFAWDIREPMDFSNTDSIPALTGNVVPLPADSAIATDRLLASPDGVFTVVRVGTGDEFTYRVQRIDVDPAAGEAEMVEVGAPVTGPARQRAYFSPSTFDLLLRSTDSAAFFPTADEDSASTGSVTLPLVGVQSFVLSPNGRFVAVVTEADPTILRLVDTRTGQEIASVQTELPIGTNGIVFSADNRRMAVVTLTNTILYALSGEAVA